MEGKAEERLSSMVISNELTHCWIVNGKKFFTKEEAMSYKDSFEKRNKRMTAEDECEKWLTKHNILYTRYGFDALFSVPWQKFKLVPQVLRNTPDYMVLHRQATLLEAKGCHDILRLKLEDCESYDWWSKICPLSVFVYSTYYETEKLVKYEKLMSLAKTCLTGIYEDNGKEHYLIPFDKIKEIQ